MNINWNFTADIETRCYVLVSILNHQHLRSQQQLIITFSKFVVLSCSSAIATQVNKKQNLQGKACEGGLVVQWLTWVIYLAHRLCKDNQISLVQIAQKAFGALSQKYVLHLKLVLAQQVSFLELELNSCVCFEH